MVNKKIEDIAVQICKEQGFELYDIEFKNTDKGKVLRVYITSPEGVKLDECSVVSRQLSNELDIIDLISSKYFLEVSSPGLERTLTKESHYYHAINETVKITYRQEDNKSHTQTGVLREVSNDGLVIEYEDNNEIIKKVYPYKTIKKVRTVFVFNKKSRR